MQKVSKKYGRREMAMTNMLQQNPHTEIRLQSFSHDKSTLWLRIDILNVKSAVISKTFVFI